MSFAPRLLILPDTVGLLYTRNVKKCLPRLGIFALSLFTTSWRNFDYTGTQLVLIFPLCRSHPKAGTVLYCLSDLPALWIGWAEGPLCLTVRSLTIGWSFFSIFAAPLIFLPMHVQLKISKWFFQAFYPAHLAAIALV